MMLVRSVALNFYWPAVIVANGSLPPLNTSLNIASMPAGSAA
ncbi:MAG: hypothetical protein R2795_17675 [Saprospiraceae bacterium]